MKRVLLTGASGWIGSHCLPVLLAHGYEVHAVASRPLPECDHLHVHHVDLLDTAQTRALLEAVQPTHLLHLAWYTQPGRYWQALENLDWLQASIALLRTFQMLGGQRVVMAGSCAEYDWDVGVCIEQQSALRPNTLYGSAKLALGQMLEATAATTGLSAAWGRVFFLYGPGERPERLVPTVIRALLRQQPAYCSSGEQIRDYLHVQDVADALVKLLDSSVRGPFNIASGDPVYIRQIIQMIADQLQGHEFVQLGARPTPPSEPKLLVANISRLRNELGWEPRYSLADGIAQSIEWWRSHLDAAERQE